MTSDPKERDQRASSIDGADPRRRRVTSVVTSSKRTKSKKLQQRHQRQRGYRKRSVIKILNKERERVEEETVRNSVSLLKVTCRNVVYFVLLYSAVLCCRAAIGVYVEGMADEIQRKYSFSSGQMSLMDGTQVIGLISSLPFVALLGRNCHKPLLLTFGVLLCSLGAIVFPVPYFAEKAAAAAAAAAQPSHNGSSALSNQMAVGGRSSVLPATVYSQACQYGQWNMSYINPCSAYLANDDGGWLSSARQTSLSILCVAGFLVGLGTGLFVTTGFVYVEENGGRKNGAIFYGVFLSMTGFGHFLGACIAWWFLGYTEDLDDELGVRLFWTTKAWWLGFVFFCFLLFVCSWIFLFFPKWISEPDWSLAEHRRRLRLLTKRLQEEKELRRRRREERRKRRKAQLRHRASSQQLSRKPSNEYVSVGEVVAPDPSNAESNPLDSSSTISDLKGSASGSSGIAAAAAAAGDAALDGDDASSSSDSDSELVSTEAERSAASLQRTSGGNGSGLGIIEEEEDSNVFRYPSSALSPEDAHHRRPPQRSSSSSVDAAAAAAGDGSSPVWPLHSRSDDSRQSRVVTFSSVGPDSPANQSNTMTTFAGSKRKSDRRITRKKIAKTIVKPFSALKRIILTPVFTLSLIGTVLSAYLSSGYRSNVVHFSEVQYGLQHIYAWFYSAGLCYSLAETIGPLVGGIIIHKLRLSLYKQTQMIISLLFINFALFLLIFPIAHYDSVQQGMNVTNSESVFASCSAKCDCLDVQLQPVCSSDGARFSSACQAGCTQLILQNTTIVYFNCSCVPGDLASGSFCPNGSSVYGAFWIVLFLAIVAHSMGQVSVILIFLRSVQEVDRHLALSAAIWVIVVAAFIPGPPVFDALEASSCTASRANCDGDDTCWTYNLDRYRYVIHGCNLAFQFVAAAFFLVSLRLLRKDPIEPVGFGREDIGRRSAKDKNEAEERTADGEGNKHSMIEVVQSRIASNLLANKPELMKFQSRAVRSSSRSIGVNREPKGEGRRKSSNDSVFVRDDDTNDASKSGIIGEEKAKDKRSSSDQSTDSAFADSGIASDDAPIAGGDGQINEAFDDRQETSIDSTITDRERETTNRLEEVSSRIDDFASTITESTKL